MIQKVFKNAKSNVVLFASVLALSSLVLTGCGSGGGGSDSYDTPATTETAPINGAATDVLVDASTVAAWIASGQVGAAASFDRKVVVLDFGGYDLDKPEDGSDRIQGSCRVTPGQLTGKRFEGVGDAAPLVATGEQIDAVIQRLGIDENTTIVFTTDAGNAGYYTTRAYWTFRYWGFPKESLKVLDGGNTVFAAAYPELMTKDVPTPTAGTFSVRDLAALNDDLRASVGEMIEIVKTLPNSTTDMVFDARGTDYYTGIDATSGLVGGDIVVVDGHPEGGEFFGQGGLYVDSLYKGGKFKKASDILAMFAGKASFSTDKKATVYCTSGYSATPLFFALEAILGVDVQLYDGSWSQLGKYSEYTAAGGELPAGSPWAIDELLEDYTYNLGVYNANLAIETLKLDTENGQTVPFSGADAVVSQVEAADALSAPGGGGVDFVAANDTATANVLIDYATLQGWVDDGLVNAATGEKVVILDVTDTAYAAGHIPGAIQWNYKGQAMTRLEGPAPAVNMVLTAAKMDERIQAAGIDNNTTVVITTSEADNYFPSRAYVLFRYWGFPKSRIKVLNGYNGAWPTAALTTAVPTLVASDLSVEDFNSGVQLDTRVSLSELMDAVRDDRGVAIDFRGDKSAAKSTPGVSGVDSTTFPNVTAAEQADYGVFEGTVKGGTSFSFAGFTNADGSFKTKAEITAAMNTAWTDAEVALEVADFTADGSYGKPVYSYCRTGYIASTGFFVMDAIMELDVMIYDGSWSQWGKMSANAANGGELTEAFDAWATDSLDFMDVITYNAEHIKTVEPLNADEAALSLLPGDTAANQVENADFDYQIQTSADADDDSAPVAGGDASVGC